MIYEVRFVPTPIERIVEASGSLASPIALPVTLTSAQVTQVTTFVTNLVRSIPNFALAALSCIGSSVEASTVQKNAFIAYVAAIVAIKNTTTAETAINAL